MGGLRKACGGLYDRHLEGLTRKGDPMILKAMAAPLVLANMVAMGAFTAGAVAGTAGVIGLWALRKRMADRKMEMSASDPLPVE
jgi:hypothetical protein